MTKKFRNHAQQSSLPPQQMPNDDKTEQHTRTVCHQNKKFRIANDPPYAPALTFLSKKDALDPSDLLL